MIDSVRTAFGETAVTTAIGGGVALVLAGLKAIRGKLLRNVSLPGASRFYGGGGSERGFIDRIISNARYVHKRLVVDFKPSLVLGLVVLSVILECVAVVTTFVWLALT